MIGIDTLAQELTKNKIGRSKIYQKKRIEENKIDCKGTASLGTQFTKEPNFSYGKYFQNSTFYFWYM